MFLRALNPGHVKTRLARSVGSTAALDLYRAMLVDLAPRLAGDRRVIPYRDGAGPTGPFVHARDQRGATLFERMANAMGDVFAEGFDRAVLIGTDIPLLTARRIDHLFFILAQHDAVLGPSADGGYYAVGFQRKRYRHEVLAAPMVDGGSDVLSATKRALANAGLSHACGPTLADVDTAEDLERLLAEREAHRVCPALVATARTLGILPHS